MILKTLYSSDLLSQIDRLEVYAIIDLLLKQTLTSAAPA